MSLLIATIPLMLIAIAAAIVPLVVAIRREHRLEAGTLATSAASVADDAHVAVAA
jgi:phosphotransferase system  glucose/maltose/N-acetylglucosamine-specific IIC component